MTEGNLKVDIEAKRIINEQFKWIIDRRELINIGIKERGASLAGFAGVELSMVGALIATWTTKERVVTPLVGVIYAELAILLVTLILAIYLLLRSLIPMVNNKEIDFDGLANYYQGKLSNKEFLKMNQADQANTFMDWIVRQNSQYENLSDSQVAGLNEENMVRTKHLGHALGVLAASQIFAGILILTMFWS